MENKMEMGQCSACNRTLYHDDPLCFRCQARPAPEPVDWFSAALVFGMAICAGFAIGAIWRAFIK